jgi:hypothetical protein
MHAPLFAAHCVAPHVVPVAQVVAQQTLPRHWPDAQALEALHAAPDAILDWHVPPLQ